MKVLLTSLNSKYIHSNLALKYLYTVVAKDHKFIDIKEFTINNDDDYMFTEILSGGYDVICFSCYIWNIDETLYLAENLKKASPNVKIIFGGPEISFETDEFLQRNEAVDFVIMGEGEYTFVCLLDVLAAEESNFEDIKGLGYRHDGEIVITPSPELLVFESIPFPYKILPCEDDKIIYFQSARGCPFNCTYCISSLERKIRALPFNRAIKDIDYFIAMKVKQVKFVDRTFNWDDLRCNEIIKHIINKDNGITNFHFEICGELVTDEFLEIISTARKGLLRFEIGVQTTNKKSLAAVKRSVAISKTLENIRKITELDNIYVHVDLIAGLPLETYDTFKKSFNEAYGLGADALQLGFLKLLKGTELREQAEMYGYKYREKAPYEIISSNSLTVKDLCRLKHIEKVLNLYYNKGGFAKTLSYITSEFAETPFDLYEEFSIYFNLKGFQHKSHKKEDLYRILHEFAMWKAKKLEISGEKLLNCLEDDMKASLNEDAVKKFKRKGWSF